MATDIKMGAVDGGAKTFSCLERWRRALLRSQPTRAAGAASTEVLRSDTISDVNSMVVKGRKNVKWISLGEGMGEACHLG